MGEGAELGVRMEVLEDAALADPDTSPALLGTPRLRLRGTASEHSQVCCRSEFHRDCARRALRAPAGSSGAVRANGGAPRAGGAADMDDGRGFCRAGGGPRRGRTRSSSLCIFLPQAAAQGGFGTSGQAMHALDGGATQPLAAGAPTSAQVNCAWELEATGAHGGFGKEHPPQPRDMLTAKLCADHLRVPSCNSTSSNALN